jgi:hypothetical protein
MMRIRLEKLIIIMLIFGLGGCHFFWERNESIEWVSCNIALDTIAIKTDATRGAFVLNDSLMLWPGIMPFDKRACDSISLRSITIWTPSGMEKRNCDLTDLYPPFNIFKRMNSDTLYVFKGQKTLLFQIPNHMCE